MRGLPVAAGGREAPEGQGNVRNRIPKRLDCLAGHAAIAAGLNECDRGQNRNCGLRIADCGLTGCSRAGKWHKSALFQNFLDRKKRRLCVQRIKNGFHQQQIHAAVEQPTDLLAVSRHQFVKRRSARTGVIYVGGNGRRFGCWSDVTCNQANPAGLSLFKFVRRAPRAFRAGLR